MAKFKKTMIRILSFVGAASLTFGFCANSFQSVEGSAGIQGLASAQNIVKTDAAIKTNQEDFYNPEVIYRLPDDVAQNDDISVIVSMDTKSVVEAYNESTQNMSVSEFAASADAKRVEKQVEKERKVLINALDQSGIPYELGAQYDTVLSGFEITIKAKDYQKVGELLDSSATVILGETYEPAQTEPVTNEVDVYETGIFNSEGLAYQGEGVVVAVLDSGLDYTHTAFDVANFESDNKRFTADYIADQVGDTTAAKLTSGLTGEDVYLNAKIPFAYDYADKDTDVLPTNSEHGTHVSGIIAGNDDTITGVAPKAQIAFMKVFSDRADGAKTSWILAGLEDCINLSVDVINMSLGSGCGFSTERDEEEVSTIYENIRKTGISLIVAAANSYNATMGSEKNGNLGLTSNPDFGTVGSPSTYDAALSVASVDGVKTPYMTYNGEIIYFNEATDSTAETKDFVEEMLETVGGVDSYEFEYVTIPGLGSLYDYAYDNEYYKGKIALVKRGTTTFEEKIKVALEAKGAAGVIIYNNVSGTISMSVGEVEGAACSIGQDDGEMLAKAKTGKIRISRDQVAGPFMSEFSSWGPTSDLKIKPEITAHGGEILSAVPGQSYDRQSGTSMASPNLAGAAAIIRSYVKYSEVFGAVSVMEGNPQKVTELVNQLMMSTADIVYNKNGLPYAVRKQGAGLVNIAKAMNSASYITTYDKDGVAMSKTKFELGDDKDGSGVYLMTFDINNVSGSTVSYAIDAIIQTEGVSETFTSHDETTVTQDGYLLDGATITVTEVSGGGKNGNTVTVGSKQSAKVSVQIVLSESDKQYLKDSFENGMYVEGFITLEATSGTEVDMNIPLLAFFGDWTKAPIFDEEFYDTNVDELNKELDSADKLMADAFATRVIGGLYSDYIATLGSYYFVQDPSLTPIAANKDYIAISNQNSDVNSAINSIHSISAGLLRNVREVQISIVEDATGREIFQRTEYNQRKSYSSGSSIYPSSIEVEFDALTNNLKNNTKYTVTVTTYIDYGENEEQKNLRNTFEFPLYIDFEAPLVTDVEYYTEYDKTTGKTKLFADLSIYDNHYAMGMQVGQIVAPTDPKSEYLFEMKTFGKYITPIYSSYNSTSIVTVELTDYVADLKKSIGIDYKTDGTADVGGNNNSFIVSCYDYALNTATYEIRIPDEILAMTVKEAYREEIRLSPNETLRITDVLDIFPSDSWFEVLDFESSNSDIADVVNQTIIAKESGSATIFVTGYKKSGEAVTAELNVKVLGPTDPDYIGWYTIQEVNKFALTGYKTNKAYYSVVTEEREIGLTGSMNAFSGDTYNLSMYPSESVTLTYVLDSYFPGNRAKATFLSSQTSIATVDQDTGTIVAQEEGIATIFVNVTFDGNPTLYSESVNITVKDPYTTSGTYLMAYKGLGNTVVVPGDRGITTINSFAFSNYEYIPKDLSAGDVIDDEDPYTVKQWFIGDNTIKKIDLSQTAVTTINSYAFAGLTALEEVILPAKLTRIGVGAFYGCTSLKKINLENVKFINERAFYNCSLQSIKMNSIVAIGDYAFENCDLTSLLLPASSQSIGIGAFHNNSSLVSAVFQATKLKIGAQAFANCELLYSIDINAAVIPSGAFRNCEKLESVTLGKDVAVIGEYAFAGTNVSTFNLHYRNTNLAVEGGTDVDNGPLLYKKGSRELVLCAPCYAGKDRTIETNATSIATGAFSGNNQVYRVVADQATDIGAYAFAGCTLLEEVSCDSATSIGDYAFYATSLISTPELKAVKSIGDYAFSSTEIKNVTVASGTEIGDYAFYNCDQLESVVLGDEVKVGAYAFAAPLTFYLVVDDDTIPYFSQYYDAYEYKVTDVDGSTKTYTYYRYNVFKGAYNTQLKSVEIGKKVAIGAHAFDGNVYLSDLSMAEDCTVGNYAFYNNVSLTSVDLQNVTNVGEYAFSGDRTTDIYNNNQLLESAYVREVVEGELTIVDYKYTSFAPQFATVQLKKATAIGSFAFAGNEQLKMVTLGEELTEVASYAFAYCPVITAVELPAKVSTIGDYAFYYTSLESIYLGNVATIGQGAFMGTELKEVTLKEGANIGMYAFALCEALEEAKQLEKVSLIGTQAFYSTALTEISLDEATYIGDFAFAESKLTSVTLGEKLATKNALETNRAIGENPFYGCAINSYANNGEATYDLGESVKIIDGVLYQVVPDGLELISYPMAKADKSYVLEDGTVRIGARAFEGALLQDITFTTTLKSIGDKAFYGCEKLSVIVFTSYNAPTLEEAYDTSIMTLENLPFAGTMYDTQGNAYEGLGISQYYMWNFNSSPNNFYYGANFVDYVGRVADKLVMVKPVNGENYDSFIFSQYFGTVAQGSTAATEATLNVIALINLIPSSITLDCEEAIVAARAAYDSMAALDQKALITNYSKLMSAESTLAYLKLQAGGNNSGPIDPKPIPEPANGFVTFMENNAVGLIIAGVLLLGFATYIVLDKIVFPKMKAKKNQESAGTNDTEE